jgi:intron-binding protein aquarius
VQKNPGPYPHCVPNQNKVKFTPIQVEAIRSGVNHGLTMVVGPPGTGKTDTAVQIVNLLFHNFPNQKIVLVAHSNQALNDLFEKIVALDIPERYLLRLGRGIEELDSVKDFSKWGRVDFMLKRRLELLELVGKLAKSLGLDAENASYTCETARFFFLQHVQSAWELFEQKLDVIRNHTF